MTALSSIVLAGHRDLPRCPGLPAETPQLVVGGWVRSPLLLDATALESRGAVDIDFQIVCTHDGAHGEARRLRAVPLAPLIEEARPAFAHRTDFKRVAIVAESSEGYRALFSWNELFNTAIGDGVMVAFEPGGSPERERRGAFALVSRHDLHTGPRYVRHLAMVEVVKLW